MQTLAKARVTGLEPATFGSTVRCSNQLSYTLDGGFSANATRHFSPAMGDVKS